MRRAVALGVVVGSLLLGACREEAVAPPEVPLVYDLDHDPVAGAALAATSSEPLPADRLRLHVEDLFEWHGISLTGAMRATATGGPGQQGWVDELAVNADEIAQAIGLVYGSAGARAFHQQWAQHAQFLVDYASARRRADAGAMGEARDHLAAYERDAGRFLAQATGDRVPAEVGESLLRDHVTRMLAQVDAAVAGDAARSTTLVVEDHGYLVGVAGALAGAFANQFPDRFPGLLDPPVARFCSVARRAVGAYTIAALGADGTAAPSPAGPDARSAAVAAAFGPNGASWDPDRELLDGWATAAAADPDALAAAVKRSLAVAGAFVEGLAP